MPNYSSISTSTTQLFLNLYDITNDLIILEDGTASIVLTVSAMNFGLLSENEQDATIYAYASLLNSLTYPIQIVIRSQPKDVTAYIKKIIDQEERTTNPTYKTKIKEYREFVESLVQEQNVLDKKFYIVIPYTAIELGIATSGVIPGTKAKPVSKTLDKNYIVEKAKVNLLPRRDHLIDQLARIGLYSRQLTTQDLIQMLYSSYNPESYEGLKVTDTSNYTTPLVQARIAGDAMTNPIPTAGVSPAPAAAAPVAPSVTPATATTSMSPEPTTSAPFGATPTTGATTTPSIDPVTPPVVEPATPSISPEPTPAVEVPSVTPAADTTSAAAAPEAPWTPQAPAESPFGGAVSTTATPISTADVAVPAGLAAVQDTSIPTTPTPPITTEPPVPAPAVEPTAPVVETPGLATPSVDAATPSINPPVSPEPPTSPATPAEPVAPGAATWIPTTPNPMTSPLPTPSVPTTPVTPEPAPTVTAPAATPSPATDQ